MKKCKNCNQEKFLSEFYTHSKMSDGHLNICKSCKREYAQLKHYEKYKDPNFVNSERKRNRDKYHRLGYKEKQIEWDKKRPWSNTVKYKNLNRNIGIEKGYEFHHWNYNEGYMYDGFVMTVSNHRRLHSQLEMLSDKRIFKSKCGKVLDSKEKHENFIVSLGLDCKPLKHK